MGDDCAVLQPPHQPQLWTIDAAFEGVHFSRAFMDPESIAYRAMMAAVSDVAAMGGCVDFALSALGLPRDLSEPELDGLIAGLAAASDAAACPIVGGNLARAGELSLTTTVLGHCQGRVLTRAGAQPGEGVFVTGTVGGAALGLLALERGLGEEPAMAPAISRFLRPRARLDVARQVAGVASAAIDISDGLMQDLGHLCQASDVGAAVHIARIPRLPAFDRICADLKLDAARLMLAGGEDYELLFTAPVDQVGPELATWIGDVVPPGGGVTARHPDGQVVQALGFDHFRAPSAS